MSPTAARRDAIALARETVALKPIYLDTYTTGLDPQAETRTRPARPSFAPPGASDGASVVDICLLDHDRAVLVDTLVRPAARIPAEATAMHGITNAMVAAAPTWPEVWPQIAAAMHGRLVAIYNRDYDLRLMRQSHRQQHMPWVDPSAQFFCIMLAYAQFYGKRDARRGYYRYQRLEQAGSAG